MSKTEKLSYSLETAAEALNISRPTMLEVVNRSDFPAFRIGRRWVIPAEGLHRWLDEQTRQAQSEKGYVPPNLF